jgi:hypothetical protein
MTRDKLITIRIEGEKREAFNQLAKSQNTDTASLLYDFINQCLSGKIDIKLVTGKKQWIDKIDNQLDTNRLDKLEATTQRIDRIDIAIQRLDNRIDGIETITQRLAKRLDDWIEAIDDRLTDCDQLLSNKITSLEHRLNALSIQLDSQQDSQQLDRIDTDSQKDSQQENPDIEPVATVETVYTVETAIESVEAVTDTVEAVTDTVESVDETDTSPLPPNQETVETAYKDEPDKGAICPVPGDTVSIESVTGEGTVSTRQGLTNDQLSKKVGIPTSTIEKWKGKIREGEKVKSTKYPDFFEQWTLNLADSLWHEKD